MHYLYDYQTVCLTIVYFIFGWLKPKKREIEYKWYIVCTNKNEMNIKTT